MAKEIDKSKVWVIIPVFNRCEITRSCLKNLKDIGDYDCYTICVVDDASSDGTPEMLMNEFPKVKVVLGNGDLFWGGGIAKGMTHAYEKGAELIVWLNDDCLPDRGSIDKLVQRANETEGICGGLTYEEDGVTLAYSGAILHVIGSLEPEEDEIMPVSLLNGNMVAIHRKVIDQTGVVNDRCFPHYGGDSIYALKAHQAGFKVELHGNAKGVNPRGDYYQKFGKTQKPLKVFKEIFWKGSPNYYKTYWYSLKAMYGWKAYYRWPAFFVRLAKRYFRALLAKK